MIDDHGIGHRAHPNGDCGGHRRPAIWRYGESIEQYPATGPTPFVQPQGAFMNLLAVERVVDVAGGVRSSPVDPELTPTCPVATPPSDA